MQAEAFCSQKSVPLTCNKLRRFDLAKSDRLLGRLELLRTLHREILIPPAVWREVGIDGQLLAEGQALAQARTDGWVRVLTPGAEPVPPDLELEQLDDGEREAIVLALELGALLVIDERDGRAVATRLGLRLTGTLGLLVEAKNRALIPSLRTELDRLLVETNFRCAESLLQKALLEAGEISPS